jgi:hypothetical protein
MMLVINVFTGAWCQYTFATATTVTSLAEYESYPYYGSGTGAVYKGENGYSDNSTPINFSIKYAWNFFNSRQAFKVFKDVRPLFYSARGLSVSLSLDTDFQQTISTDTISSEPGTVTLWGSTWGSSWSSTLAYLSGWYSVRAQGHSGSLKISGSLQDLPLEINAIDLRYELGAQV